jgi:hypothetical protein
MIDPTTKNRTSRLGVRLTETERRKLLETARRCGMTISEYLRRCALEKAPRLKRGVLRMDFISAHGDLMIRLQRLRDYAERQGQAEMQQQVQGVLKEAHGMLSMVLDDPEALQ